MSSTGQTHPNVRRPPIGSRDLPVLALCLEADIRSQIQRLRGTRNSDPAVPVLPSQRATDASLRARHTAALARNQALADENAWLRRQLAGALGDPRSAWTRSSNDPVP